MSVFFELQLAIRAKRTCDVQKSLPQLQALQDPLDEFSTTVVVTSFKEAVNYHRQFRRVLKGKALTFLARGLKRDATAVEKYIKLVNLALRHLLEEQIIVLESLTSNDPRIVIQKADCLRYLCEIRTQSRDAANKSYEDALQATLERPPTNSLVLTAELNYCLFLVDICRDFPAALHRAQEALDKAESHLDSVELDDYQSSAWLLQLIRENVAKWAATVTELRLPPHPT